MEVRSGYKQTEVGIIPEDWETPKIGDSAFVTKLAGFEYTHHFDYSRSGPVIAVRGLNIKNGTLDLADVHTIPRKTSDELPRSKLFKGELVISYVGTLGRVAVIPEDDKFHLAPNVAKISVDRGRVVPEFLAHFLNSFVGQKLISDASASTTQAALSMGNLRLIEFARPPLPEQRAIAATLSEVDALLGGLDRLIDKKRDLRQAAMQQLLTGQTRLPGFHGEWEVKELGQLGSISGAGVDKTIRPGEPPVRLVNYMDVYRRSFIRSRDLDHVVSASPDQAARCAVRKGDIFFTPSSEMPFDIAASAVAMEDIPDACYSYHVVRLRLGEDWDLRFRAYAFQTQAFLDQAARTSEGSGVRYVITQGKFRQLTIRYPSDRIEQGAIATILSDMDAELAALEQRHEKTHDLKQAMIQELLTGKTRLVPAGASHG